MSYRIRYTPHKLRFKFDARTSRGAIQEHQVYYLSVWKAQNPEVVGLGECAPLAGLSIDHGPGLVEKLDAVCNGVNSQQMQLADEEGNLLEASLDVASWPAIRFALETALLDLKQGGRRVMFDTPFSRGKGGIPINGLIWMGDKNFMQEQIRKKLTEGYTCLKLKIGGLDFASELELLASIREAATADELTIRVDANGAFKPEEAFRKLERLAKYDLHSIEQPIRQGQWEQMAQLCAYSPVPIALDEELIGVQPLDQQTQLLERIRPQYIILKPTLVGGLAASAAWIRQATKRGTGWWMTSALESNIGLNAISQFTATYDTEMPQGLGTGQLYHNNIASPLQIEQGRLWYNPDRPWGSIAEAQTMEESI